MYNISPAALDLFKKNYRQVVNIIFRGKNRTFTLTESDIRQGGFSIDRYSISGSKIEIGSAVAAELLLTLENNDDRFSNEIFEGAELEVKIGIKKWDAYHWENAQIHWIPCGYFTIDDQPRKLASISLTALDRMVKFDLLLADGVFPNTVENIIKTCCNHCGVALATDLSSLPNKDYMVTYEPDEDEIDELTYRQVLQWCAEITGTCAYIDWNGKLRMQWYENTSTTISASDRYNSDMYEADISITGVQFVAEDDTVYLAGTDAYAFDLSGNKLITHDQQDIVNALNTKLNGFSYRPYSCTIKPMPHIYPMDKIVYVDKKGVSHSSIITNCTYKLNNSTTLAGKGETLKKKSYARANPLNRQESIVVQKVQKKIEDGEKRITQSFQAADGVLESIITAEVARATGEESKLSSRITQNADSITAEVARATGEESKLSSRITQNATDITAKVSSTGGISSSFSWSLTASGFVLNSNSNTVMEVTSSGLKVSGDITASTGNIAGLAIDKKSGTISQVTKHTASTIITLSSPSSEAVEDTVPGWYYLYGNVEEFTLADLGITTPNAILGEVIIQNATTNYEGMGIVDINSTSVSFSGYIRAKMTSGTVRVTKTVTFDYYTVAGTTSTFLSLYSADDTFNLKSAKSLSKSVFTIGSAMVSEADIVKLSSIDAYIGGLHITDKTISYSSCGFEFDENTGDNYSVSVSYVGNTILLYINGGGLPYEKTFEVQYKENGSNLARIKSITVAAGSTFAAEQVPIFGAISEVYLVGNGGYLSTGYNFTAGDYKKAIVAYGGNLISAGAYNSTYHARIGHNLGDDSNWWNNLYVTRVYLQQLYQAGALVSLSDRHEKYDIEYYNGKFDAVFDELKPATFKFNKGESGRTHIGLIAQDIKETLKKLDISTTDFAAYCEWQDEKGNTGCGIRYEELIALCISEIQKLKQKVKTLESVGGIQ